MHQPLVSIITITYNQERWIEATLDGVFSQTYPNIEWVISDDCSTDGTWDRINTYIATHDVPRERIILNRNEKNMRITANYNKCLYELAHGDLLVINEGDDISLPYRVERLVELHLQHPNMLLGTKYGFVVDDKRYYETDNVEPSAHYWGQKDYRWHKDISYRGCTLAIPREVVEAYPPFRPKTPWIDSPLTRRAMLMKRGGVLRTRRTVNTISN